MFVKLSLLSWNAFPDVNINVADIVFFVENFKSSL